MVIDDDPAPVKRGGKGEEVVDDMRKITEQAGFNAKYEWISGDEVIIIES